MEVIPDEKEPSEPEIEWEEQPFRETDFEKRVPSENYKLHKELEDLALSVQKENLKVYIVCAGILYGKGEETFHNHFKHAWLQDPELLPYLGDGRNIIPTIHKSDLISLVE